MVNLNILKSKVDDFLFELVKVLQHLEKIEIDNLTDEQQLYLFKQLPSLKTVNNKSMEQVLLSNSIKQDKEGQNYCFITRTKILIGLFSYYEELSHSLN